LINQGVYRQNEPLPEGCTLPSITGKNEEEYEDLDYSSIFGPGGESLDQKDKAGKSFFFFFFICSINKILTKTIYLQTPPST
jgi:hypothetical protein